MVKNGLHILLVTLLVVGVAGFSGCRRHSHAQKAEFLVDYITETLDLTASQQTQLNQIKDELMEKALQLHADKASMHEELVTQLRGEIDQTRVKAMIADHRARMDEIIDLVVERLAEFHQTLTAEQKEKLVAKIQTFEKWHGKSWD